MLQNVGTCTFGLALTWNTIKVMNFVVKRSSGRIVAKFWCCNISVLQHFVVATFSVAMNSGCDIFRKKVL